MKFSSKARYGLRAVYELGKNYESETPISNSKLALLSRVSEPYLEKIMSILKKQKIVVSKQGLNGGYILSVDPKELTIGRILTALEGNLYTSDCVEKNCNQVNCPNRNVFTFIYQSINATLNKMTLYDVLNKKI
ncbi:MAG: Rrf2 family transcriptional regulator [Clostridia bacterium]|nr:Rrf2 family transcriptional regulator [Clostridia bacterium]